MFGIWCLEFVISDDMGRSYYYFAASLPMIDWEGKAPMSVGDFLSECRRLLREDDFALIGQLLEGDGGAAETGNAAARSWIRFDGDFRNELAWFRARRMNRDPVNFIRGTKADEPFLREAIRQASKMPNLLEAEKSLDRIRWQFLDDLAGGHYYDFESLMVYGLKLKILERHQAYNSPAGRGIFDETRVMEFPESCILESGSAGGSGQ